MIVSVIPCSLTMPQVSPFGPGIGSYAEGFVPEAIRGDRGRWTETAIESG